jgi:hypothetical protein
VNGGGPGYRRRHCSAAPARRAEPQPQAQAKQPPQVAVHEKTYESAGKIQISARVLHRACAWWPRSWAISATPWRKENRDRPRAAFHESRRAGTVRTSPDGFLLARVLARLADLTRIFHQDAELWRRTGRDRSGSTGAANRSLYWQDGHARYGRSEPARIRVTPNPLGRKPNGLDVVDRRTCKQTGVAW